MELSTEPGVVVGPNLGSTLGKLWQTIPGITCAVSTNDDNKRHARRKSSDGTAGGGEEQVQRCSLGR